MSLSSFALSEIMSQPLTPTSADVTVQVALELAAKRHVHHFPVMEEERLVGFVCTCDMYHATLNAPVSSVMKQAFTLDSHCTAHEAAELMRKHAIGSVLVMEDSRLCGIVTRGDLLEAFPMAEGVLGPSRCSCCGLTRHLRDDGHGGVLCMYCDERATDDGWFELGMGG